MTRSIRFGYQLNGDDLADPVGVAQRAEAAGFDVVSIFDHVGAGPAPMTVLAAMASATERIQLAPLVLNNDMRNPVQLASEAVTLDQLSGGRFELGLGAGHTPHEYAAAGIQLDPPKMRKSRLAESTEIVRRLMDGETVDYDGDHYKVSGAKVGSAHQDHIPILVGGNGAALLGHAGCYADAVGLQGLGRTKPDGQSHSVRWTVEHLDRQLEQIRNGAGDRFDHLELQALVQVVVITGNSEKAISKVVERIDGLTVEQAIDTPYLLIGTIDEIIEKVEHCRQRFGITYYSVRTLEDFIPVIEAFA